jgi:hypothetical protein
MNEAEYYASEFTDTQIDALADAGQCYLNESGFYLMPTREEIDKMAVEGEAIIFVERILKLI